MEKKQLKPKQKTSPLALRKETFRQLKKSELPRVACGGRLHIPGGFADDTTPIYIEVHLP